MVYLPRFCGSWSLLKTVLDLKHSHKWEEHRIASVSLYHRPPFLPRGKGGTKVWIVPCCTSLFQTQPPFTPELTPHVTGLWLCFQTQEATVCASYQEDPEFFLHLAAIWSFGGGCSSLTPGPRLLWRDEIEVGHLTLKRAQSQIRVTGLLLVGQRVLAISTRVGNSSKENKL